MKNKTQLTDEPAISSNGMLPAVLSDVEAVKELAKKHIYLNTISYEYLYAFEEMVKINPKTTLATVRTRFRKALNKCVSDGIAKKSYQGSSAYQTGDTLGGKVYIDYDFMKWVTENGR